MMQKHTSLLEKAKTLNDWENECRKLSPKNALKISPRSKKWIAYDDLHLTKMVRLEDAQQEIHEQKEKLQEIIKKISEESEQNTTWLRDCTPKSERRISVLHARIESYQYCLHLLKELSK